MLGRRRFIVGGQRPRAGVEIEPNQPLLDLCRGAHGLWCRRMIEAGWSPGAVYDADQRVHDALVPFDRLGHDDRVRLAWLLEVSALVDRLAEIVDYPRGRDAPLRLGEIRAGMRVASVANPSLRGTVQRWATDPTAQRLVSVVVLWDSGETVHHVPEERELIRLTPPE